MLRDYVGRLFGFDAEILGLREKVRELSWDDAYHMYTRPAFLQFAQIMPRGRRILAFIDLDYIHRLDQELGYTEVDRRVQSTFSVPFRRSDIVARWYSGDEIVILFDSERDGAERKMEELAVAGRAEGLTFKFAIGDEWAWSWFARIFDWIETYCSLKPHGYPLYQSARDTQGTLPSSALCHALSARSGTNGRAWWRCVRGLGMNRIDVRGHCVVSAAGRLWRR